MPKILISADLLSAVLFPGAASVVTVIEATFDQASNVLELVIVGDCVPHVPAVTATVTLEQRKTTFEQIV